MHENALQPPCHRCITTNQCSTHRKRKQPHQEREALDPVREKTQEDGHQVSGEQALGARGKPREAENHAFAWELEQKRKTQEVQRGPLERGCENPRKIPSETTENNPNNQETCEATWNS